MKQRPGNSRLPVAAQRQGKEGLPVAARQQQGMALIEVLVSILIFAFGILGLIGLESRAINFSSEGEDRNRAALIANEIASNLWLNGSATSAAAWVASLATLQTAWQPKVSNATAAGVPNGIVAITAVGGTSNTADITITWVPPSRLNTDLSTLTTRVILP